MSNQLTASLNRLLRGISTYHVDSIRQAWRELLINREYAIPLVQKKLSSDVWCQKPNGSSNEFLGVLLALLHELNLEGFKVEIERLQATPLHPAHRQTVEIMAKRLHDKLFGKIGDGVPVYISNEIEQPHLVFECLQNWSQTPALAFAGVTRVDVIASRPEMDYLGRYNLLFDGIVLTWRNESSFGIVRWWRKIATELTFYHEVGHHYFQHKEGGQVEEQEQEADRYQWRMFRNAHPYMTAVLWVILLPVYLAMKLFIRKRKYEVS